MNEDIKLPMRGCLSALTGGLLSLHEGDQCRDRVIVSSMQHDQCSLTPLTV